MPKNDAKPSRLSRREQNDLDIEIAFLEGLIRRDPHYLEALRILGDDYTRRGRVADGLRIDEQLCHLRPQDPLILYNLACSYSLTGQCDRAASALEQAIRLGYRDFRWLARDPDLQNLRKHPLYRQLRAKLRSLKQKPSPG